MIDQMMTYAKPVFSIRVQIFKFKPSNHLYLTYLNMSLSFFMVSSNQLFIPYSFQTESLPLIKSHVKTVVGHNLGQPSFSNIIQP